MHRGHIIWHLKFVSPLPPGEQVSDEKSVVHIIEDHLQGMSHFSFCFQDSLFVFQQFGSRCLGRDFFRTASLQGKHNISTESLRLDGGVAQVVESLPSKCEALTSNPSTTTKNKTKKRTNQKQPHEPSSHNHLP
jgi:hypothetical protein